MLYGIVYAETTTASTTAVCVVVKVIVGAVFLAYQTLSGVSGIC